MTHSGVDFTPDVYWKELTAWGSLLVRAAEPAPAGPASALAATTLWERLEAQSAQAAGAGIFLPAVYVMEVFQLTGFSRQCLALTLLSEMDGGWAEVFSTLEPSGGGALTGRLAARLCGVDPAEALRALAPDGPLSIWCMENAGFVGSALLGRILRPAERIVRFAVGTAITESGLPALSLRLPAEDAAFPGEPATLAKRMADYRMGMEKDRRISFLLRGEPGAGRRTAAHALANRLHLPLLTADARGVLDDSQLRLALLREAVLQQCPVCLTGSDALLEQVAEDAELARDLTDLLEQSSVPAGFSLLVSSGDWTPQEERAGWQIVSVEVASPELEARRALWETLMTQYGVTDDADALAASYRFTPGQITRAMESAASLARWQGLAKIDGTCLRQGCRAQLRHALGEKARRVETVFTWADLVLPEPSTALLMSACDQMRRRRQVYGEWGFGQKLCYGAGLSMLFSGPPGTGKTMAAQIVAGQLGMELYKVDLSAVVSKYVGETEKNLNVIFREAGKSQAVLFFDEADVLFGKRTEVKDSHDKYNNMEAAFLLQKMEEYSGVSVLATNFVQNFDEAFKRRIRFVIDFPFPDAAYRLRLWQGMFPSRTPLGEVDWSYLAQRFELSGSGIKNVAVNAAFLASRDGVSVGMGQILTALKREFYKSGKLLQREDFGEYFMLVE